MLFIHGYPLSRQLWQPQVEGLADVARLLAPDLRGHGDSQATPPPYSMELFADDLNAFLDALGITQPVVLCGLSMGGYVAFAFYRKYARRVTGLILTATRATADSPEMRSARDQAAADARRKGVDSIINSMLPRLVSPRSYQEQPELVERVRTIMRSISLEGMSGDLAGLRDRPDSTPLLGSIHQPTLLLPGMEDQIISFKEADAMRAAIPGARLQIIPEAGHLPNLENPTAFNQAIREFLQDNYLNQAY